MGSLPWREPRLKPKKRVADRCPIYEIVCAGYARVHSCDGCDVTDAFTATQNGTEEMGHAAT
jgi:hypothetical protein